MSIAADSNATETFWKRFAHMEALNKVASEKLGFIRKVESGAEVVSWGLLDRLREAQLQLNQAAHCFTLGLEEIRAMDLPHDARVRLEALAEQNAGTVSAARTGIETIMSWVPPAPNTRRSDGNGLLSERRG